MTLAPDPQDFILFPQGCRAWLSSRAGQGAIGCHGSHPGQGEQAASTPSVPTGVSWWDRWKGWAGTRVTSRMSREDTRHGHNWLGRVSLISPALAGPRCLFQPSLWTSGCSSPAASALFMRFLHSPKQEARKIPGRLWSISWRW